MSPHSQLIIAVSAFLLVGLVQASSKPHDRHEKHNTCQEFTQGQVFNDSQAIGTWHLLHFKTEKTNGSGESHCVQFSLISDQIPCASISTNKTRDYYLERLEGDGSYRTLQMPPSTAKLDLAEFHRYPMRLKIIESQYLGMMDCHEKFMFLMGKQPPEGRELDERLKKMIDAYWPNES
ncbi:hypothetical protein O3G_MSEX000192 [Manduca sexta]|nr:hypothetical protein O3G_MSEX000192 [Manduca sexta]